MLEKRSLRVKGHRTSVALEEPFWIALEALARARAQSLPVLIASIDEERANLRPKASLASAVRVHVILQPTGPGR